MRSALKESVTGLIHGCLPDMRRVIAAIGLLLAACSPQAPAAVATPTQPDAAVLVAGAAPRLVGASMAYDIARSQMVLFGSSYSESEGPTGFAVPASMTAETWIWQSGKWTKLGPATSPPPRTWAGMAYDEVRHQVVLFGAGDRGSVQSPFTDTWTWDGKTWSQRTPSMSPPASAGPSLVYDAKLGRVVALVPTGDVTQTWTWDGNTWAQLHPTTELQGRGFAAAAAYDPAHGSVVVFGADRGDKGIDDTWTFDGTTWARHIAVLGGPTGRGATTLAYDPSAGKVMMFGGWSFSGTATAFRDTWTWDGANWTQASPSESPWERSFAIAATDINARQVVLYGGMTVQKGSSMRYSDVWTWAHGSWSLVQPTAIPAPPEELDAIVSAGALGTGLRPICAGGSTPCMSVRGVPQIGYYAAYAVFDLKPADGANAVCISYVSYIENPNALNVIAKGPWHPVGVTCSPSVEHLVQLGGQAQVKVSGCANVRTFPALGDVVSCLSNGTRVTIDEGPVALNGDLQRIWWHLQKRGWMANELLLGI